MGQNKSTSAARMWPLSPEHRHLGHYRPQSGGRGLAGGSPSVMETLRPRLLFSYPRVASDHRQSSHRPLAA